MVPCLIRWIAGHEFHSICDGLAFNIEANIEKMCMDDKAISDPFIPYIYLCTYNIQLINNVEEVTSRTNWPHELFSSFNGGERNEQKSIRLIMYSAYLKRPIRGANVLTNKSKLGSGFDGTERLLESFVVFGCRRYNVCVSMEREVREFEWIHLEQCSYW